ncbi:hypothetical protein FTW19_13160 [Terriglobus albidus]|uniref:UvrD-like helicase C-terminal domain-containing protein n=1 Tax=Terriglobus albidus TaxID=1592106 RepID=A0A5B9E9G8_9BACT|nr:ATP-binding domain-containing protein [Terriglobus albidus]QEE28863.1 hypothetical protein FTW19_13160 [Terriglobus albidus]
MDLMPFDAKLHRLASLEVSRKPPSAFGNIGALSEESGHSSFHSLSSNIESTGCLSVALDSGRTVAIDVQMMPHIDHGYAVTSHSSQGLTADRVLVDIDASGRSDLVNQRFAYVSISRGAYDAKIFTNDMGVINSCYGRQDPNSYVLHDGSRFRHEWDS